MKALVVETQKIRDNLKIVREVVEKNNKKIKLIAVIKGNGYGLGLVEYAQTLADNGIEFFAVATVEEAIKLRQNGIKQDILMMSSTAVEEDINSLIENDIILTVGSKESGEAVEKCAKKNNKKVKAHIKIDTGFGRYGFIYTKKEEMIETIKSWKNIQIEGMFSHFSLAFYGKGREVIGRITADHTRGNAVKLRMRLHFAEQFLILVDLCLQLIHEHDLAEQFIVFLIELLIFVLDIIADLHAANIIKEPAGAGREYLLHGLHHIRNCPARNIQKLHFREKLKCDQTGNNTEQKHHNQSESNVAQLSARFMALLFFLFAVSFCLFAFFLGAFKRFYAFINGRFFFTGHY